MTIKLAVLASGRGSNFQAILQSILKNELDATIKALISDNKDAKALTIAKENNIPTFYIPYDKNNRIEFEKKAIEIIDSYSCDLIILAGFMRILTSFFVKYYENKILNIHPSLLPAFKGLDAQKQALLYGVKITGCSVHIVTENLDDGPILAQRAVPVYDNDTVESLSQRILEQEHILYVEAIKIYEKKYIDGRRQKT
ncbi:MAG: phosphoribosylglycinamide formyltransferase [Candidatus Hydrogenedentota bacterium]